MADGTEDEIRVLVVDDERDLRTLIRHRLGKTDGFAVVGEAEDSRQAIELATAHQPHVVLLDLLLGAENGINAVGPLLRAAPAAMITVLTALPAEEEEQPLKTAGAFAYYEKTMLVDLADYIREDLHTFQRALQGEDVVAPSAVTRRR